jgi:hypothetical protein
MILLGLNCSSTTMLSSYVMILKSELLVKAERISGFANRLHHMYISNEGKLYAIRSSEQLKNVPFLIVVVCYRNFPPIGGI